MPPYRLEYKRTVDGTWILDNAALTAGQFPRSISGLIAGTQYDTRCRATDVSGNIGNFSATSQATTQASAGGTVLGSFHYDPVSGNNANNGILVGQTGSGATLNGTAGTGARQTQNQFASDMATARYRPGDTVYIHPPGFVFTAGFAIQSNSTTAGATKLLITSLPGQRDNTQIDVFTNGEQSMQFGQAVGPIHTYGANVRIEGFVVVHQQSPFSAGGFSGLGSGTSFGCEWVNLVGDQRGSAFAPDNSGFIRLVNTCNDFLIRGVKTSNSGLNANNGLIYYINVIRGVIENCDLTMAGQGACIHHKRSLGILAAGDITIRNNFLKSTTSRGTCHLAGTARHRFQNNIHSMSSGGFLSWGLSGGTAGSDPAVYECQFIHETFHGGATLTLNPVGQEANLVTNEGYGVYLRSNLFGGNFMFWARTDGQNSWPSGPRDTNLDSNFNHFKTGAGIGYFTNTTGTLKTLPTWQGQATGDVGQDASSVAETTQYAGTPNQTSPASYLLAAGSAGKNAGHDGTDMGANVANVGPAAIGF